MDLDGDHSGLERASRQARTLRIAAAGDLPYIDAAFVHDLETEYAMFAVSRAETAAVVPAWPTGDLEPLFKAILDHIPAPIAEEGGFQMLVANRAHDDYTGPLAIGRVFGLALPPRSSAQLKNALKNYFFDTAVLEEKTLVLLIDEAQNLTDDGLETLRLLRRHSAARERRR